MSQPKPASMIAVSAVITASPKACYDTIADYRVSHSKIIPPKYFGPITVERGGTGAGTRFTCSFKMFGRELPFTSEVTEPVPGRVLSESLEESGAVTTFTVVDDGAGNARVAIDTKSPRRGGLPGMMERWMMRRLFPPVYTEQLRLLAEVVQGKLVAPPEVVFDM